MATIQAHQQRPRLSTHRWTIWAALYNPIAFMGWAPKPKRKRRDARTVASALPEWYEHHTPAALQALPPRPAAGSDKKRVAFAEAKTRTFDPKAPPCMVAALEETVACIHQDGAAKAMDRFISSVGVVLCPAPMHPRVPTLTLD